MSQQIALVSASDEIIAYQDKLSVHEQGLLHRAFSLFIFNNQGQILLQQRAANKYHSAGLWSNTCCSHLPQDVDFKNFMHDRLFEEMGFDCAVKLAFRFHYFTDFDNGLIENEIDHVYVGVFNGDPIPNAEEVMDWKWLSVSDIELQIVIQPHLFSYWFKQAMLRIDDMRLAIKNI